MRLLQLLLVGVVTLAAACSRGVPIMQAQAICQKTGDNTNNVTFYAYAEAKGWGPPHMSDWRSRSTNYVRLMTWADLGRETPLRGVPVRIQDDNNVFPNPAPSGKYHATITGTFVCKDRRANSVMLGYLIPTSIIVDK